MAVFCRTKNLISNCRMVFNHNNRFNQTVQYSSVKTVSNKLKELNLPEKPKKPLSGFFRYLKEHRTNLLKENPNLKVTELAKQCAADWKNTDSSTKQKYDIEYKQELEKYAKDTLKYETSLTHEQKFVIKQLNDEERENKKKRELKKKLKENHRPKRPLGSYMIFVMDQAKIENKSFKELLTDMKGKWMNLTDQEKAKYIKDAEQLKAQYNKDMEKWERQMLNEGKNELVRTRTLAEKRPSRLAKGQ